MTQVDPEIFSIDVDFGYRGPYVIRVWENGTEKIRRLIRVEDGFTIYAEQRDIV